MGFSLHEKNTVEIEEHTSGIVVEGPPETALFPWLVAFACFLFFGRLITPCTSLLCFGDVRRKQEWETERNQPSAIRSHALLLNTWSTERWGVRTSWPPHRVMVANLSKIGAVSHKKYGLV